MSHPVKTPSQYFYGNFHVIQYFISSNNLFAVSPCKFCSMFIRFVIILNNFYSVYLKLYFFDAVKACVNFARKTWSLQTGCVREYWMIRRWPGFYNVVWFGSSPTSAPSPVSKLNLADGKEGGSHKKASLLVYKSFNTLWAVYSSSFTMEQK